MCYGVTGQVRCRWIQPSAIEEVQICEGEIVGELKSAAEVSLRQVKGCNMGLLAQFSWLVEMESENSIATK